MEAEAEEDVEMESEAEAETEVAREGRGWRHRHAASSCGLQACATIRCISAIWKGLGQAVCTSLLVSIMTTRKAVIKNKRENLYGATSCM